MSNPVSRSMTTEGTQMPTPAPFVGLTHRRDVQPLTPDEVQFEIDMCIGCDRCMRACPVPISMMVNIADLNSATVSRETAPHIARFTDECVMCGSCVPVCPVDNHRDLLMLSLKQRLGIDWDGQVQMNKVMKHLPSGWDITSLLKRLREQPMFSNQQLVPDNYLLHFVATSRFLLLDAGTAVMREGDFGRDIYFILEGQVELSSCGPGQQEIPLAILRRGEYIGEQGMLTGQPRNASARTRTQSILLVVTEQVMQRLMEIVPAVEQYFKELNLLRTAETILRHLALFEGMSSVDTRQLIEQLRIKSYERDELLFGENHSEQSGREALHLILDGFVKVARRIATSSGVSSQQKAERIIAYRQRGDYFVGGMDMQGDRRAVSVTAITRVTVAALDRSVLIALFTRYPAIKQRFQSQLQSYRASSQAAHSAVFEPLDTGQAQSPQKFSDPAARAGLHALVDDGVVEGTDILVIDLEKCIHCNECEEACERRHGHSRMNRKGMVVGNISIATACRQCQDPVCMLCSRGGIARKPGGEVYITDSCIGCGICAERCPYNNISIISLDEDQPAATDLIQTSWQKIGNLFSGGAQKEKSRVRKPLPMAQPLRPGPLDDAKNLHPIDEIRKKNCYQM